MKMKWTQAFTFFPHAGSEALSKSAVSTLVSFVFVHHTLPAEPSHTETEVHRRLQFSHLKRSNETLQVMFLHVLMKVVTDHRLFFYRTQTL